MRSVNRAGALFLSAAALCVTPAVSAQDATPAAEGEVLERIRVRYRSPPGCPDRAAFIQQVQARTAKAQVVEQGPSARVFWVEVEHAAEGYRGRLVIQDQGMAVREVHGETCPEIVSALGLVTALAIDPKALTKPTPPPPLPTPSSSAGPDAVAPGGVFVLPELTDAPALSTWSSEPYMPKPPPRLSAYGWPWPPADRPLPVIPTKSRGPAWQIDLGAHAGAMSATAPDVSPQFGAFVHLGSDGEAWLRPTLRGSFIFMPTSTSQVGAVGEARIGLLAGRLDGCPVRAVLARETVQLSPCLGLDVGALDVEGTSGGKTESHSRPWVAGLLFGRIGWRLVDPLVLEAQGGAVAPFVQDEFFFEPDTTAHLVPAVGGFFSGGVGVHIW